MSATETTVIFAKLEALKDIKYIYIHTYTHTYLYIHKATMTYVFYIILYFQ